MTAEHVEIPVRATGPTDLPPGTNVTAGVPLPPGSRIAYAVVQRQGAELVAVKGTETREAAYRAMASLGEAMPDLRVARLRPEVPHD